MANSLRDKFKGAGGGDVRTSERVNVRTEDRDHRDSRDARTDTDEHGRGTGSAGPDYSREDRAEVLGMIEAVEIEAVLGGALQRIRFGAGTNPAAVAGMLRMLDPNVKVRDAFPSKFGGNRESKLARAMVLTLRVTDSGKFIDLVCKNGDDLTVSVSKKSSDGFPDALRALGKVHERNLAKVQKAFAEKGNATVILTEDEQFGVKYWTTDDGKNFLEEMVAAAPAVAVTDGGEA